MQLWSHYPLTCEFTSKELHTKLQTIFESTRLHHTMKQTYKALSQDDLRSAEWRPRTNEKQPIGNKKPTGNECLWKWWKKPTTGGESNQLMKQNNCTIEVRLQTHYSNAAPSTSQTHLRRWRTSRWESLFERRALTVNAMKPRMIDRDYCKSEKICDELCARDSKAIIQNSRAYGTVTMVSTPAIREPRLAFRNLCTGKG